MSRANVDLAYRAYDALQRDGIEAFLNYVHPEAEWHSLVLQLEGDFHGHDGVREWWQGILAVFPDWRPSMEEPPRDLGDWVLIHARVKGNAVGSGIAIDDDLWQLVEVREGLVVWYGSFRTEEEALAVVRARE
jgi:hypothetical protein